MRYIFIKIIINYNDDLIKNIGNLGISNLRNELFDYENNIEFPMEMLNKKRLDFKKEIIEEVLNAFQQSIKNSKKWKQELLLKTA